MNNEQRLIELAHELPEPILAEVLDFAEYLQQKQGAAQVKPAGSFAMYFGALKDTPLFEGQDPLEVQRGLRNERR